MAHPLPIDGLRSCERRACPFMLLDAAACSGPRARSYLFLYPQRIIQAWSLGEVEAALIEAGDSARNAWVAGYLCYEAGYALENRLSDSPSAANDAPLLWLGVFDHPCIFDHATGRWDRCPPSFGAAEGTEAPTPAFSSLLPSVDFRHYQRRIAAIRKHIAAGDTYQVNFTYDVLAQSCLAPFDVYRALRRAQPTPYCAYIRTPHVCIASFSPELFFSIAHRSIRVRPMKGTASRGRFEREDAERAAWLAADEKNRSENVMIVDMMRNDLGRICNPGAVRVERLFQVERHTAVLQMTSTVRGSLRSDAEFSHVIRALFPSGSVTGAPKIRTMEIIRALETGSRGPYCGAIGFIAPRMRRAVFSVPIRTLVKERTARTWRFRVGSGIVWDSNARDEWNECATKCAFLTRALPKFEIFESMLCRNGRLVFWKDHRARLRSSARYFGYPLNEETLTSVIAGIVASLGIGSCAKVRIFLASNGRLRWDASPLDPAPPVNLAALPANAAPTQIATFAAQRTDSGNPLLFHKTTHRPWYSEAMDRIRRRECFDVIFCNQRGEITEGARSNVFILRRGKLLTPALDCGLLPGVLRARLLRSSRCSETVLTVKDVRSAEAVFCGNSVQGLVRVKTIVH